MASAAADSGLHPVAHPGMPSRGDEKIVVILPCLGISPGGFDASTKGGRVPLLNRDAQGLFRREDRGFCVCGSPFDRRRLRRRREAFRGYPPGGPRDPGRPKGPRDVRAQGLFLVLLGDLWVSLGPKG